MRFTSTAILALGLVASSALRADEEHACKPFKSAIVTHQVIPCPADFASPVGLCTVGRIDSGPLKGDTRFRALSFVPGKVPGTFLYTGELVITTKHGILTINDTGTIDFLLATFFETDLVVDGTGRFEDANWTLMSFGNVVGNTFVGTIARVCREGDREDDQE